MVVLGEVFASRLYFPGLFASWLYTFGVINIVCSMVVFSGGTLP